MALRTLSDFHSSKIFVSTTFEVILSLKIHKSCVKILSIAFLFINLQIN